ncbi:MAG: DUF1850 domain-containing protein [Qingshengfaniella sp.]
MMLCIAAGGPVLALAVSGFTLSWTHSVEKTRWWERWEIGPGGLRPVEALITGSGAGMEPPANALRTPEGWRYEPKVPPQDRVLLAASGMTGGGWTLCAEDICRDLGADPGTGITLYTAPDCRAQQGDTP